MTKLRQQAALQDLIASTNLAHSHIENGLDAMRSRWAALREHYLGLAAEGVESEISTIFAQTEQLLNKLADWREQCESDIESGGDVRVSSAEQAKEEP